METHLRYPQSPKTIPLPCCHRLCMSDSRQCSASACLLPFRLLLVTKDPRLRFQDNTRHRITYLSATFRPIVWTSLRHTPGVATFTEASSTSFSESVRSVGPRNLREVFSMNQNVVHDANQARAATTRAFTPVSKVGWITGANRGLWLVGSSLSVPSFFAFS